MSSSLAGWNFILLCIRNTVVYSPMGRQIGYVYVLNSASLWKKRKKKPSRKSYEIFAILLLLQKNLYKNFLCLNFNCFHITILPTVALNDKRHTESSMYALYINSQQEIYSFIMLMLKWIIQLIQTSLWASFPKSYFVISRVKPSIDWRPVFGSQ